ncbi:MAG: Rrf2 family transcriptional regulator [Isosphaera sp.]|nr:Rrf2 family transcriptional regulator [Isosphaera sp.]
MLSQAVGYAITALGTIASAGGRPVLVKEIAEAARLPAPYLAKIVHALAKKGLVVTQRGVGGGVSLARPAVGITLMEVATALDDPITSPTCMLGTAECSDARACPAHRFWTASRANVLEFLRQTTVADIAAFESRRRWRLDEERLAVLAPPEGPQANTHGTGEQLQQ